MVTREQLEDWKRRIKGVRLELYRVRPSQIPMVDRPYYRAYLGEVDRRLETAISFLEELEETR